MSCQNQIFSFETKRKICLPGKTILFGVCVLKRILGGQKTGNFPTTLPKFNSEALQQLAIHLNPHQKDSTGHQKAPQSASKASQSASRGTKKLPKAPPRGPTSPPQVPQMLPNGPKSENRAVAYNPSRFLDPPGHPAVTPGADWDTQPPPPILVSNPS